MITKKICWKFFDAFSPTPSLSLPFSLPLHLVMAASHLLLKWAESSPKILAEVYRRIRTPLLTLYEGAGGESQYALLLHIAAIASREEGLSLSLSLSLSPSLSLNLFNNISFSDVFRPDFLHFFCRHNEYSFIRIAKMNVLKTLSSPENAEVILNEVFSSLSSLPKENIPFTRKV
jgi:hypothetical protein